ncbi:MAG: LicD family protein [Clostridia bacterium]|nr:LicD family protein [Clostridia bacterium]
MEQNDLSKEFFEPEYRSGYYVSEKMKKVWAVELDLLKEFDRVCTKHNLAYFMNGGTLLGAVRHGGFIPWDDDVDVIMPRQDYDKLWEIAKNEFKEPYFFQTALTEKRFFRAHAQLRRSDTTGFIELDREKDINKGIFLDIFVLDGVPGTEKRKEKLKKKIERQKKMLSYKYDVEFSKLNFKRKLIYIALKIFFTFVPYRAYFKRFNKKALAQYSYIYTKTIGDLTLEWRESVHWKREWYEDIVFMKFENLFLRAPKKYHEILTKQYGDYMKIPEDINAKNQRSHEGVTFDPDTPYKEYFKKIKNEAGEEK